MGNVILGLLLLGPQTLYSLNKQFEQGISLFYRASYGSLQSALKSLLAKGHVTFVEGIEGGRNKKIYSITDAGRAAFFDWMGAPVASGDLEVLALSKLFFLGLLDDRAERARVLDDLVVGHRSRARLARGLRRAPRRRGRARRVRAGLPLPAQDARLRRHEPPRRARLVRATRRGGAYALT